MTKEQFSDRLQSERTFDFSFKGTTYVISMEKNRDGKMCIFFGEQYFKPEEYENFTHLMADAKIQNHFLREVIAVL